MEGHLCLFPTWAWLVQGHFPFFQSSLLPFLHPSKPITDQKTISFLLEDLKHQIHNYYQHQLWDILPPTTEPAFVSRARVLFNTHNVKHWLIVEYHHANQHLKEGYRHLPLHPAAQPLLAFNILGRFFQPLGLNFGLTTAPYVFTKVINAVVGHLRKQGVRVSAYLDDFIVFGSSPSAAQSARDQVVQLLRELGLTINMVKGVWHPQQRVVYLGLEVDCSSDPVFRLPEDKVHQVHQQADSLLREARKRKDGSLSLRQLQSFCGLTNFLSRALACARLFNRVLFNCMRQHAVWRRPPGGGRPRAAPGQRVPLTEQALADLRWWAGLCASPQRHASRPVLPPSLALAVHLTTDASSHGWGCLLGDQVTGADRWDPATAKRHINVKELLAVQHALRLHLPQLEGQRVLLLTDNTTVCHILATGTTRSTELLPVLRDT